MLQRRLRLYVLGDLGRFSFGGRHFAQISRQPCPDGHSLGWRPMDVHGAYRLVCGTPRLVVGISLGSECLGRSGPASFADDGFPGA